MVKRMGERALRKRVYPHLLRHTSATYWSNRLSWFKLCKRFGWAMTSSMPQRYIDREGVDEIEMARAYCQTASGEADSISPQKPDPVAKETGRTRRGLLL